jgi:hypothetical protein
MPQHKAVRGGAEYSDVLHGGVPLWKELGKPRVSIPDVFRPWFPGDRRQVGVDLTPNIFSFMVEPYRLGAGASYVLDCCRSCVPPTGCIGQSQAIEQTRVVEEALTAENGLGSSLEWHVGRVQIRWPQCVKYRVGIHIRDSTRRTH